MSICGKVDWHGVLLPCRIQNAHFLNADSRNVKPPAAWRHLGIVRDFHAGLDGFLIFIPQESNLLCNFWSPRVYRNEVPADIFPFERYETT
jgi:hypothetical protein